jgi:TDG/mug DNA glycosylase family protein
VADEIDDAAKTWRATAAAFGPSVVAFAGKRQYAQLFDTIPKRVEVGKQPPGSLPPRWPFCEDATEVWVLPSSSGRAAMTREARETPYLELGARLAEVEWPRRDGGFRGGAERRREPMKVLLRYDR